MGGTPQLDGPWHGVPRAEIDWHPSVDDGLCSGCGMCTTSCGRKVFEYDFERRKSVVAQPLHCMVGCVTCENLCPQRAIGFPPVSVIAHLIKERHILAEARDQLAARRPKSDT